MGFESLSKWSASSGSLSPSATKTEGEKSLSVSPGSYSEVQGAVTSLTGATDTLALDLRLPTAQPNPDWYGFIQLSLDCPSRGVYSQYLGQKDFKPLPLGSFTTVLFGMDSATVTKLDQGCTDLRFKMVRPSLTSFWYWKEACPARGVRSPWRPAVSRGPGTSMADDSGQRLGPVCRARPDGALPPRN
jgi:hypothetical protein